MFGYSESSFYVVSFGEIPDVMCSWATFITQDFHGNEIQSLHELEKAVDQITFSLIATDSGGAAVFNWVGRSKVC